MVFWENKMPSSDVIADADDTVADNLAVEEVETSTESSEETHEDELTAAQRKRRARVFQRSRTRELATLDLINSTNDELRKVLRIAGVSDDLFSFVMKTVCKKDRELIRLRRLLLRGQDALAATQRNLLPRLKSKAQQARYLQEAVNSLKNHRPKGKVAIDRFERASSNGG